MSSLPRTEDSPTASPNAAVASPDDAEHEHELELVLRPEAPADAAGAVVRSMSLHLGLPAERATRMRAVVEELVREARGRECVGDHAEVVVRTRSDGDRLHVTVTDRRLPLDAAASRRLPSRRLAALGFVDRLHVASHGAEGNLAECELSLHDAEAELLDGTEVLADDVAVVDDAAADALVIRRAEAADAAGVARCVYRCYGYSYLDPIMYRPRLLARAWRAGQVHSVVAVRPDGEVVGHIALTYDRATDLVPEGGKLVVDPRYRGHHLAERLAGERLALARDLGLSGIWVECVTNHPFSQKEVLGGGGAETGLLIGCTPASVSMTALASAAEGRHSLLTMWIPVAGTAPSTVHVPDRLAPFAASVLDGLGQQRHLVSDAERAASPAEPLPATSQLSTAAAASIGLGHLRVQRIGADLVRRVADELDGLSAFDLAAVHLDLPVGDPAAADAIDQLGDLGFFWGAWLPGFVASGDALRLQRIADRPVDVEHVVCASEHGEQVRDRIVEEWRRVRHGRHDAAGPGPA
jgi:N-acetylglutamate synthase-like GNAT family acetyltransferase/anti-sigma regulatory factor (Ser/Thr protein kinase)